MFILIAFVCYIIVTRVIKTIMYFTWSKPRPPAKWFWYIGPFIIVQYWGAVIKLYALCTLKDRRWGNREVKVNAQNEVVRTGEFEDKEGDESKEEEEEEDVGYPPIQGVGDYVGGGFSFPENESKYPEVGAVEMGRVSR